MNISEGRGKIFRTAKQMRKDKRDVMEQILSRVTREIKVEGAEVCGRWKEYFDALLNGESELEVVEAVEGPLHEITEQEVERRRRKKVYLN